MNVPCPVCKNPGTSPPDLRPPALRAAFVGPGRSFSEPPAILRCCDCGAGYVPAPPDDVTLARIYRDLDADSYERELRGRERAALRQLQIVHRHRRGGRLLDVGCASGIFLKTASEAGWEVVGVEPSMPMSTRARARAGGRAIVVTSTLQDAVLPPASFDCITLWDVLEHMASPADGLRRCATLLAPGGILIANVPDIDSVQARLLRQKWPLWLPEHLVYFNHGSLRRCGELAGLTWVAHGRRPASFSLGYLLDTLARRDIPTAGALSRVARRLGWRDAVVPVYGGELYGVWTS